MGGDEGGVVGRAGFLWRRYQTIGEADGALKYADAERAISQLQRDEALHRAGFQVVHFNWEEINRFRTRWPRRSEKPSGEAQPRPRGGSSCWSRYAR